MINSTVNKTFLKINKNFPHEINDVEIFKLLIIIKYF